MTSGRPIHPMSNKDWEAKTGDCLVCGPGTPMTSKGTCLIYRRERAVAKRRARGINGQAPGVGRGRKYPWAGGVTFLTRPELEELYSETHCQICGVDFSTMDSKHKHIDHCHTTGEIRGVLCQRCNHLLGGARDDVEILQKAIAYLTK